MNDFSRQHHRPRVLQLSYACSPVRGSEAGLGWRRAVHSAKHFDTWVICEENEFADEIRDYTDANGEIPGLNFVYVPINQREWAFGNYHDFLWYMVLRRWHRRALQAAKRLHERLHFDLVHQVTFCGYREPSDLWKMDAPFVWGPIGGTQNYPSRFLAAAGLRGAFAEGCRSLANSLQLRFSPRVRKAARRATVVVAANSENQRRFGRAHGIVMPTIPDVGMERLIEVRRDEPTSNSIKLLWSGKLMHCKALHLLINALARLPVEVRAELHVLGRGSLEKRWRRQAEKAGVADRIKWFGWLPHCQAIEKYGWADAFVFSSLRDTTGTVVVEALAAGLPVICFDHQGVRDVVTENCGLKIPVTTPNAAVDRMAEAISRLARDTDLRRRLANGAVARAKEYLWSKHEQPLFDLYSTVIERHDESFVWTEGAKDIISRPTRRGIVELQPTVVGAKP